MSVFRLIAFASPLFLGFVFPFVLALGRERKWSLRKRSAAAALVMLAWTLILAVLWAFSGEPLSFLPKASCFLLAFAAFLYGLFHFFLGFRIPPVGAQVLCGIVVIAMVGTIFYFDPILEEAQEERLDREDFQQRVDIAIRWNPYAVLALSVFEDDILTHRTLYTRTMLADLQRTYPDWKRTALWYVLLGFWFYIGYVILFIVGRLLRGR